MDSTKLEQLITENMKSVFGFALTRLGNVNEAEYLASDILYALIGSAKNLKDEKRFYGFLWKIAENTYMEYLRKKSKTKSRTATLDENISDESETALDVMIKKEELNLLRRELSLLSKQYRDTTVLYYINNYSCSEVAEKLNISTEMVKYYLFRARKIIREGMNMERLYGEKSYYPHYFEIDFWGTKGGEDSEYRNFQNRKIKGNILLAAYYTPVTLQELSIELGVSLPYLEDEIKLLIERQYLICKGDKYLTNIPIFTLECSKTIDEKLKELIETAAEKLSAVSDDFIPRFGDRFADENLARWNKMLLCMHYSMTDPDNDYGELPENGPYSLVNGGGGRGIVWGRSAENANDENFSNGIQGIYNNCTSDDGRGRVIAMNFRQTLNAQRFESYMTTPLVCTAVDCYSYLPKEWKDRLDTLGYATENKANFAVWTEMEYKELRKILAESISLVSELNRRTSKIAADITADLAPAHIRTDAKYVGSLIYRFHFMDDLVSSLYDRHWLTAVDNKAKPAVCVIKN